MKDSISNKEDDYKEQKDDNSLALAIAYGLCSGSLIGTVLSIYFGIWCIVYGSLAGLWIGLLIGCCVKKSK